MINLKHIHLLRMSKEATDFHRSVKKNKTKQTDIQNTLFLLQCIKYLIFLKDLIQNQSSIEHISFFQMVALSSQKLFFSSHWFI